MVGWCEKWGHLMTHDYGSIPMGFGDVLGQMFTGRIGIGIIGDDINSSWESSSFWPARFWTLLTSRYGFVWKCWVNIPNNYSHLTGIMISKTIGENGVHNIFRHIKISIHSFFWMNHPQRSRSGWWFQQTSGVFRVMLDFQRIWWATNDGFLGSPGGVSEKHLLTCFVRCSQRIHVWNIYLHWDYFKLF